MTWKGIFSPITQSHLYRLKEKKRKTKYIWNESSYILSRTKFNLRGCALHKTSIRASGAGADLGNNNDRAQIEEEAEHFQGSVHYGIDTHFISK